MAKKVKSNNSLFEKLESEKVKNQQETTEISATVEQVKLDTSENINVVDTSTFIGKLHSISPEDKEKLNNYDRLVEENTKLVKEKMELIDKIDEYLSEIEKLKEENNQYLIKIQEISQKLAVNKEINNKKVENKKSNIVQSFNRQSLMTGYKSWN